MTLEKKYILFYFVMFVVISCIHLLYIDWLSITDIKLVTYAFAAIISQSSLFLIPFVFVDFLLARLKINVSAKQFIVFSLSSILLVILVSDLLLFRMYGYHINGFVINLFLTPGGLESLGADSSSKITMTLVILGVIFLTFFVGRACEKYGHALFKKISGNIKPVLLILFVSVVVDKSAYGFAYFLGNTRFVATANSLPFYVPVTFRTRLLALGFEHAELTEAISSDDIAGGFYYPRKNITLDESKFAPNIIWITAESWRADTLSKDIMPNLYKFSEDHGVNFKRHYSGGNGTRMGMFTQFYGLPGRYWFSALNTRKPPVLMDVLQQRGYDIRAYSGARFSYPEFDQTIFGGIPKDRLQDNTDRKLGFYGWQADKRNVSDLLESLQNVPDNKPYMRFIFLESAHARYYFPENSIIRRPYLEDVNYAKMLTGVDIGLLKNRYLNSVRHLDNQIGRIIGSLKDSGTLENTIIVITGDHGEAFMENGRWGHNSEFTNVQTRVPLVMHLPGKQSRVVTKMTSHIDIPATLLPMLGVINNANDYTTGEDLFSVKEESFITISDWTRVCIVTDKFKVYRAVEIRDWFRNRVTTIDDQILDDERLSKKQELDLLTRVRDQLSFFLKPVS